MPLFFLNLSLILSALRNPLQDLTGVPLHVADWNHPRAHGMTGEKHLEFFIVQEEFNVQGS
jgi:hypothetical protein